jgi:hypothetical protein
MKLAHSWHLKVILRVANTFVNHKLRIGLGGYGVYRHFQQYSSYTVTVLMEETGVHRENH